MMDITFNKFVCYILNCKYAPNKQLIFVDDTFYVKEKQDGANSVTLSNYTDLNSINSSNLPSDFKKLNENGKKIIEQIMKMKQYINVKYVPDYIVKSGSDATQLDIKQSIYQIFNILKTSFDAKKWYIDINFTPNKPSPQQNYVTLTSQFIGGENPPGQQQSEQPLVQPSEYDKFLQSVIDAFVSLLNGEYKKPSKDDDNDDGKLIMYVLSKINYYIAKQYVRLAMKDQSIEKDTTPYKNSDFNDKVTVYNGTYDNDNDYQKYYQKEILDTMNIYVKRVTEKNDPLCQKLFSKDFSIVRLFNTIKRFLKKQPTLIYQTPITTYTYKPTNIRPLIYKRASESDLSNFATQIASDAFLNKNKLPVIYDFNEVKSIANFGGSDVNNSSNVYRTIYVKILNMLNAKKITLNDDDKTNIENKLNELEQLERELKEQLGDYAKYVSVSHDKLKTIKYSDVQNFLNEYEEKIKKYNSDSAKIVRFISRLTPYLY